MERDAARAGKMIVGDKSPSSTIHGQAVRDMHDVYPDAKLVYIVRDGRDVLISECVRNFEEDSKVLRWLDICINVDLQDDAAPFSDDRHSICNYIYIHRVAQGCVKNLQTT